MSEPMTFSEREAAFAKVEKFHVNDALREYDDLHPDGYCARKRSQRVGLVSRFVRMQLWKLAVIWRHWKYARRHIARWR